MGVDCRSERRRSSVLTYVGGVKSRRVCFHVSGAARGKSCRVLLLPPTPLPKSAPLVLENVLEPSSLGAELHQGQTLQRCYNFFPTLWATSR